jgi:hypothetical protein
MTNAQPNSNPLPAVLVYGTPSGPALPQASWFRAEDKEAVKAAAAELKFSVIELQTDTDGALAAGAHEGVLKGSGRMIVGSGSAEVYRRIEEHVRKGAGARDPYQPDNPAATTTKSPSEQNKNLADPASSATDRPNLVSVPNPWKALRVGARVLAPFWNEKREFDGFWLATVKRIENGEFTLEWFEAIPGVQERGEKCRHPAPGVPRHWQVAQAGEIATTIIILFAWGGLRVAPLRSAHADEPGARHAPFQTSRSKAMTSQTVSTVERIRELNDAFRRTFVGGTVMITAGIEALPVEQRRSLLQKVRAFDVFTDDNDPHGEHDFGAVDEGGVRCFWKIDY